MHNSYLFHVYGLSMLMRLQKETDPYPTIWDFTKAAGDKPSIRSWKESVQYFTYQDKLMI